MIFLIYPYIINRTVWRVPKFSGEPRGSSKGVQTGIVAQAVVH